MLISVEREGFFVKDNEVTLLMKDDGSVSVKRDGVEIIDRESRRREISNLQEKCRKVKNLLNSLTVSNIDEIFLELPWIFKP